MKPFVSAIVPMHNEEENAHHTLAQLASAFDDQDWTYELIPVDDGSTDATGSRLQCLAAGSPHIRPVSYLGNRGRGYALRRGFAIAKGDYIVTLDADLSYCPEHAVRMLSTLIEDPELDIVIASPYITGGSVEGVPILRLMISRLGNAVLSRVMHKRIHTSTGMARAYAATALHRLDPVSDGKEIHLEILSNALALGMRVVEMPSVLRSRKRGRSKFRPRKTIESHLVFVLMERAWGGLFALGLTALVAACGLGLYTVVLARQQMLNPQRPIFSLILALMILGTTLLSMGAVSMQLSELRKNMFRVNSRLKTLEDALDNALVEARPPHQIRLKVAAHDRRNAPTAHVEA